MDRGSTQRITWPGTITWPETIAWPKFADWPGTDQDTNRIGHNAITQ
jgi:hypothetical protein